MRIYVAEEVSLGYRGVETLAEGCCSIEQEWGERGRVRARAARIQIL